MHRLSDHFRLSDRSGIERRPSPGNFHGESREIDDTTVPTVAAEVMGCPHENAIDRARFYAKSTKHTFGIVDRVTGDLETLAPFDTLLADVNTVDRARFCTLIASDAGCQVKTVKTSVTRSDGNWFFGVFELFGESSPVRSIRFEPVA